MREIKFRGREESGHWCYGDVTFTESKERAHIRIRAAGYYPNVEVVPATVGQFTGLLDTAQKEIYEGDIVVVKEDGEESRHVVRYMDDEDYPAFDLVPESMSWCGECNGLSYCMIHMDAEIYVIGNIYDNPELLEAHA